MQVFLKWKGIDTVKKLNWLLLILFSAAAAFLRILDLHTGFDAAGLPVGGKASLALPLVLIVAAAIFPLLARSYPAQRDLVGGMDEYFDFTKTFPVMLCVLGAFALFASVAASLLLSSRTLLTILLAVFRVAAGASVICTLFALRRGELVSGVVLLTPVYTLVLQLIFVYRATAVDPVLAHFYVEILALAALTAAFLEFSAFAFRNGAPRIFVPLAAMAVILCVCTAVGTRELSSLLFYPGFALILLGYCAAADFSQR